MINITLSWGHKDIQIIKDMKISLLGYNFPGVTKTHSNNQRYENITPWSGFVEGYKLYINHSVLNYVNNQKYAFFHK